MPCIEIISNIKFLFFFSFLFFSNQYRQWFVEEREKKIKKQNKRKEERKIDGALNICNENIFEIINFRCDWVNYYCDGRSTGEYFSLSRCEDKDNIFFFSPRRYSQCISNSYNVKCVNNINQKLSFSPSLFVSPSADFHRKCTLNPLSIHVHV